MSGRSPKCGSPLAELHSNGVNYGNDKRALLRVIGNDWRLRPRRKRKAA